MLLLYCGCRERRSTGRRDTVLGGEARHDANLLARGGGGRAVSVRGGGCGVGKAAVVIDQDAAGPGGTDMMSILVLLQARDVRILGITVVTGDQWRDEEVAHTLRLLELVGRADIPVAAGAVYPLVRTQAETRFWEQQYGKVTTRGPGRAGRAATMLSRSRRWRRARHPNGRSTRTPRISCCAWCANIRTR